MKYVLDLDKHTVTGPATKIDKVTGDTIQFSEFMEELGPNIPFQSGLLPVTSDGVLSIRRAAGYEQIVYQRRPGIYSVRWGQYERDSSARNYQMAHPWRIIIADFHQGNLLGVRHFYSPENILSWDQPLFAVNLPNTNTIGYRGTSVGWVCLYRTDDTRSYDLAERIRYIITRESGLNEPYNDANMSGTDGTRYYQNNGYPEFMWDRYAWEKKSAAEGFNWICDPKLLVPIHIANSDTYAYKNVKAGAGSYEYTLHHAVFNPYSAYYSDEAKIKPINALVSHGWDDKDYVDVLNSPIRTALGAAAAPKKATGPEPVVVETIGQALKILSQDIQLTDIPQELKRNIHHGYTCDNCQKYVTLAASAPNYVYNVVSTLSDSPYYSEYTIDLPDEYVFGWDEHYDFEHGLVIEVGGRWCTECYESYSKETNYWIEDKEPIQTGNGFTIVQTKIRFSLGSFHSCFTENELVLKPFTVGCQACYSRFSKVNASTSLVYDKVGGTSIGCVTCLSEYEYVKSEGFFIKHSGAKSINLHVDDSNTVSVASLAITNEIDGAVCACGVPSSTTSLTDLTDGTANVCNACISPFGTYQPIFNQIVLNDSPEDNNGN